ncbi:MAG: GNAT family N-acetyltransferase [Treponema sp.]|jgi:GNAT superfamily N-acetyltransferase|nr:GNAT family N-acetyltransferase [Treponema sp.]
MKHFQINEHILLRFAEEKDSALILDFIRGLAEYEHLLDKVQADEANLRKYIFEKKIIEVIIGEYDGKPAGFTLFFYNFSTFLGKPGIYIEDLFIKPEFRGKGLGKIFFAFLAGIALERDCGRLEWACLNWNEPAIRFYKSQGGRPMDEWTTYRVMGEDIEKLAGTLRDRPCQKSRR